MRLTLIRAVLIVAVVATMGLPPAAGQRGEVGGRRSEVGDRRSEVGDRRSEVGGLKSEVGSPAIGAGLTGKPDLGSPITDLRPPISDLASPTSGLAPPTSDLRPPLAESFTPSPEFQAWITNLVREQLPANYEKRKNWGHTAKAFDGISIRLDDGQIKTHRKFKEANDGQWQMYRVTLKDPAEQFDIQISNLRKLPDGKVGLDIAADASLEVFGRQSLWQHGVQLYSLSAEADARVRLWATAEVATRLDPTRLPPDIYLQPEVTAARFEIPDFRLRRIGEFHGPVVRSLSHAIREALEEKLADDNQKIVAKLNRAIDKQEKKLKLSMADVLKSKWGSLLSGETK